MANISAKLSLNVPAITALCKGAPGSSILNGTGAPASVLGNDGDFYIDTATFGMYGPRSGGVWGSPTLLNNNFLAPKWNSSYDTLSSLSATWVSTYSSVYSTSARWSGVFSTTRAYSADWNQALNTADNVYSTVYTNSGGWGSVSNVFTTVNTYSGNWNAAYTGVNDNGVKWSNVYSTVYANSASWDITADVSVRTLTGNWQNTYSSVYANSANWNAAAASAGADVAVRALTGNWQNTYLNMQSNSAKYEGVFTLFNAQSAKNINVYTAVYPSSAKWNDTSSTVYAYSAAWGYVIDTTKYNDTYTTVHTNSATWILEDLTLACSDETTNLSVAPVAATFRAPFAMYLNEVRASVNTAPVGSTIIINISAANTSIFSTLLTIDQNEETSITAAVPAVISNPSIADNVKLSVSIDQVGSTTPGTGLKITLKGYRV